MCSTGRSLSVGGSTYRPPSIQMVSPGSTFSPGVDNSAMLAGASRVPGPLPSGEM